MTALLKYDVAKQAVAEAKTFDEVRDWEDKAAAVREYSRRIADRDMELDALEIQTIARRRRGEMLRELKFSEQLADSRKKPVDGERPVFTLGDLGISKDESARDQKIAALDGNSFDRLVARCRAYAESHPEKHSMDVLRPPGEPINGARAIMGSRQEPDDSLDYFPTPPWATRALMQHVLPYLGLQGRPREQLVWEPACGEGHIAEVLSEYFAAVTSSDVFDYGYGLVYDFLRQVILPFDKQPNWIITNPPFAEKALEFVEHAINVAPNVAMFFRSQWAVEGIERYQRIFRETPPTLCAFFVERVNLCKGRWDPEGTTATAYCWLLWIKDRRPVAPLWIPPGCREALSKPDDAERFTTNPVTKTNHESVAEPSATPEPACDRLFPAPAGSPLDDDELPHFARGAWSSPLA